MENIITSKDNPIIKLYQKLSSSKKERIQYGLFVLEGLRITQDALNENAHITHLILTENSAGKFPELFQADLRDTKIIVISNELGNRISATSTTQGVYAICGIPQQKKIRFSDDGKYIVLYGLQDPGNVGMIIRTADALGMNGIIISNSCDLYSPKVIRSTMGSVFRTDIFIENDIENLFSMLESNEVITSAGVIDGEINLTACSFNGKQAVFVGNEGNGLPQEISARCNRRVTIPMNGNINSLNVAMASGILMWEMQRGKAWKN